MPSDLEEWLGPLSVYYRPLVDNGYDALDIFVAMGDAQLAFMLDTCGVTKEGHRAMFMNRIRSLKQTTQQFLPAKSRPGPAYDFSTAGLPGAVPRRSGSFDEFFTEPNDNRQLSPVIDRSSAHPLPNYLEPVYPSALDALPATQQYASKYPVATGYPYQASHLMGSPMHFANPQPAATTGRSPTPQSDLQALAALSPQVGAADLAQHMNHHHRNASPRRQGLGGGGAGGSPGVSGKRHGVKEISPPRVQRPAPPKGTLDASYFAALAQKARDISNGSMVADKRAAANQAPGGGGDALYKKFPPGRGFLASLLPQQTDSRGPAGVRPPGTGGRDLWEQQQQWDAEGAQRGGQLDVMPVDQDDDAKRLRGRASPPFNADGAEWLSNRREEEMKQSDSYLLRPSPRLAEVLRLHGAQDALPGPVDFGLTEGEVIHIIDVTRLPLHLSDQERRELLQHRDDVSRYLMALNKALSSHS